MHTSRTTHILDLRHNARVGNSYAYARANANHPTSILPLVRGGGRLPPFVGEGRGGVLSLRSPLPTNHSPLTTSQFLEPTTYNLQPRARLQATQLSSYKLTQPITRVCSILLLVLAGSYTLHAFGPSLAYFTDTEGSSATMSTGILTIDAEGGGVYGLACNENAHIPISVSLDTSRAGAYTVRSELVPDSEYALCEGLTVAAWQSGEKRYEGPLLNLLVEDISDTSDWEFIVESGDIASIPDGALCGVAVVFEAFCPALGYMNGGFTDQDAVMLSFTKESCGDDDECDDPTCCVGDVDIDIINVNTDVTDITVDSSTNTGGNTIISSGGTNTIISGDTSNNVTIIGGTQSNIVDINLGCGCESASNCASPCPSGEMIEVKPPSSEEGGDTVGDEVATDTAPDSQDLDTTPIDTRIQDIRANLDERLAGVRGR